MRQLARRSLFARWPAVWPVPRCWPGCWPGRAAPRPRRPAQPRPRQSAAAARAAAAAHLAAPGGAAAAAHAAAALSPAATTVTVVPGDLHGAERLGHRVHRGDHHREHRLGHHQLDPGLLLRRQPDAGPGLERHLVAERQGRHGDQRQLERHAGHQRLGADRRELQLQRHQHRTDLVHAERDGLQRRRQRLAVPSPSPTPTSSPTPPPSPIPSPSPTSTGGGGRASRRGPHGVHHQPHRRGDLQPRLGHHAAGQPGHRLRHGHLGHLLPEHVSRQRHRDRRGHGQPMGGAVGERARRAATRSPRWPATARRA